MREILFRGKRTDNDEWIKGYLHKIDGIGKGYTAYAIQVQDIDSYMCRPHSHEVQPKTVGQFTGFTDKNGKMIFEGDIAVVRYTNGEICSIGDIQFDCGVFGVEWTVHKKSRSMVGSWGQLHNLRRLDDDLINHIEVIGNIHDNPELLGE